MIVIARGPGEERRANKGRRAGQKSRGRCCCSKIDCWCRSTVCRSCLPTRGFCCRVIVMLGGLLRREREKTEEAGRVCRSGRRRPFVDKSRLRHDLEVKAAPHGVGPIRKQQKPGSATMSQEDPHGRCKLVTATDPLPASSTDGYGGRIRLLLCAVARLGSNRGS